MDKVRTTIEDEIEAYCKLLSDLEAEYPEVLELEAPYVDVEPGKITIMDDYKPEKIYGLNATLLRLTGKTSVRKVKACGSDVKAMHELPGVGIRVFVWNERRKNGCQKYRVTTEQVIEVCSPIDESQYLSVELLEGDNGRG